MPMFLRLIHFTTPGLEACRKNTQEVMSRTLQAVESCGAKVVAGFATLGTYDVVSIMSARDEEHVAAVHLGIESINPRTICGMLHVQITTRINVPAASHERRPRQHL